MKSDRERWDARYAAGDDRHDVEPLPLLVEWVPRLAPGRALDVAAGRGRHALLLARAGWTVDAVDISLEALRTLRARAASADLRINLVLADLDGFACRPASYDLVVQTFFLKRRLLPRLRRWVRPGGLLYIETHLAGPDAPGHSRYALRPGELRRTCPGWEVLAYDEGAHPEGRRSIATARLLARRPAGRRRTGRPPHRTPQGVAEAHPMIAVAIDGPMGSGKSTVAREVARRLGFRYIDTGAMYRAVAVAALRRRISPDDEGALAALAHAIRIELHPTPDGTSRVLVDGEDVTPSLRSVEVNRVVSRIARVPGVREALGTLQRRLGERGGVVMEGRDIGSVILPQAQVKVFLTASPEVRAQRRQAELATLGEAVPLADVRRIEEEDDRAATTRAVAPLRVAPGATVIDSTGMTVAQVVDQILRLVSRARGI
jgi:CMP/dCMP kinase